MKLDCLSFDQTKSGLRTVLQFLVNKILIPAFERPSSNAKGVKKYGYFQRNSNKQTSPLYVR